jgi:hypothetical protein
MENQPNQHSSPQFWFRAAQSKKMSWRRQETKEGREAFSSTLVLRKPLNLSKPELAHHVD